MRIPGWLVRPLIGPDAVRFLTQGFPTTNDRFGRAVDWSPRYPSVREGFAAVVDRWLERDLLDPRSEDGDAWQEPSAPERASVAAAATENANPE
ncbi:hypothetical protein [Natronococcus occultus]|uniref:hypothetical protein n=1 Tax=Natronococcus occultus TaxID=29288 RepID=UPI0006776C6D|nr:hypothetical protein [Natronococcus occultus]